MAAASATRWAVGLGPPARSSRDGGFKPCQAGDPGDVAHLARDASGVGAPNSAPGIEQSAGLQGGDLAQSGADRRVVA